MDSQHRQSDQTEIILVAPNAHGVSLTTTAFRFAVEQRHTRTVEALLQRGADPNQIWSDSATPLYVAARNGDATLAGVLLQHGANPKLPGVGGESPLRAALLSGTEAVYEALVDAGANVSLQGAS